jgi:hypothetical protein
LVKARQRPQVGETVLDRRAGQGDDLVGLQHRRCLEACSLGILEHMRFIQDNQRKIA